MELKALRSEIKSIKKINYPYRLHWTLKKIFFSSDNNNLILKIYLSFRNFSCKLHT